MTEDGSMSFEELIENLVYSASASVAVPNREVPAALAWAAGRLTERYGESAFALLLRRRELERALANLRDSLTAAFAGLGLA